MSIKKLYFVFLRVWWEHTWPKIFILNLHRDSEIYIEENRSQYCCRTSHEHKSGKVFSSNISSEQRHHIRSFLKSREKEYGLMLLFVRTCWTHHQYIPCFDIDFFCFSKFPRRTHRIINLWTIFSIWSLLFLCKIIFSSRRSFEYQIKSKVYSTCVQIRDFPTYCFLKQKIGTYSDCIFTKRIIAAFTINTTSIRQYYWQNQSGDANLFQIPS